MMIVQTENRQLNGKFIFRGLYAIVDTGLIAENNLFEKAEQALMGGAAIIQYRDKTSDSSKRLIEATRLLELCNSYSALLIINDDVQLASDACAHGVHIGKDDAGIDDARHLLGKNAIIGVSCYNSFEQAVSAQNAGADYIAFGSFFSSAVKPDAVKAEISLLRRAKNELDIPIVAIGGITSENGLTLVEAGADMLAAISDVFCVADTSLAAQRFRKLFA